MTEVEVVKLENTPEMVQALNQMCKEIVTEDGKTPEEFEKNLRLTNEDVTEVQNIDNDYERELVFYQQAIKSVIQARKYFNANNYPHKRPVDYYAEMLKSDAHMERIRPELMKIQKKIEAVEQRKKNLEMQKEENKMKKQKRREDAIQRLKAKKEKKKARFRDKALAKQGRFNKLDDKKITNGKVMFGKKKTEMRKQKGGNHKKGGKR
ncbi:hypothetical protein, conserved [Entamoeba dispar SAW760]|uniref:rRNA processing protein n=1 Tax=Entamoeba dispar (strain ATCC PRA-260 / SAW760) TaxID=370354 RepID=B0ESM2_ENTDS|nr:uncharacterized protein EDI_086630 [Entamoeba dispar SAW760]EDR22474.1 hypothetical protein, conserved [Entamoeba dispar SAW760]|eukprot:EDR22474.1 hypothetical protein, conserved [Entamoeba dispar SAW760]